ncbi:hypothetical protein GCM10028801_12670 [Nocardioides maradonensis]
MAENSGALDAEAKRRVRDALRAQVAGASAAFTASVADEQDGAELDQVAVTSVDDLSQSDEAGELAGRIGAIGEARAGLLAQVDALDFGVTDTVRPGAVVAFGGDHYVVGVAADSFEVDGTGYEGISADSPLLEVIAGLRAGDSFTFNGRQQVLDLVV